MTVKRIEAYGQVVWADIEMDLLRRKRCLCLNCTLLDTCDIAQSFFEICRAKDVALAVTRCKRHLPKPPGHDRKS